MKKDKIKQQNKIDFLINSGKLIDAQESMKHAIREKRMNDYLKWRYKTITLDEERLLFKAIDYEEEYFKDLTLEEFAEELTACERIENGKLIKYRDDFSQDFDLRIENWRFMIVDDLGAAGGNCNAPEKVIRLTKENKENEIVLLHEMIHAYEDMLAEESEIYKQFIIIKLYRKLRQKIQNLMKWITYDCHRQFLVHTPFFMLKSLDLDLRLKKPHGTVYQYDRQNLFFK